MLEIDILLRRVLCGVCFVFILWFCVLNIVFWPRVFFLLQFEFLWWRPLHTAHCLLHHSLSLQAFARPLPAAFARAAVCRLSFFFFFFALGLPFSPPRWQNKAREENGWLVYDTSIQLEYMLLSTRLLCCCYDTYIRIILYDMYY